MTESSSAEILQAIGSIVVTAGHIEWSLLRATVWVRGLPYHQLPDEIVKLGWSGAVAEIRHRADTSAAADRIASVLAEHDIDAVTRQRNNVVHGAIDTRQPPPYFSIARFPRAEGSMMILGSASDLWAMRDRFNALLRDLEDTLPAAYRRIIWHSEKPN